MHYRQFGATSHREGRRTWELQMKEGVLAFLSYFDSFGLHGRLEGVNICLLIFLFSHSMLHISPFSGPTKPC